MQSNNEGKCHVHCIVSIDGKWNLEWHAIWSVYKWNMYFSASAIQSQKLKQ
jgi:hypothetical protein